MSLSALSLLGARTEGYDEGSASDPAFHTPTLFFLLTRGFLLVELPFGL
jgi:hypothetical protein